MIARRKGTGDEGELRRKDERVRLRERWEGVEEAERRCEGDAVVPISPVASSTCLPLSPSRHQPALFSVIPLPSCLPSLLIRMFFLKKKQLVAKNRETS